MRIGDATFYLRYTNSLGFADETIPMSSTGRPVAGTYDLPG